MEFGRTCSGTAVGGTACAAARKAGRELELQSLRNEVAELRARLAASLVREAQARALADGSPRTGCERCPPGDGDAAGWGDEIWVLGAEGFPS